MGFISNLLHRNKDSLEREIDAFMEQLPEMLKQHEGKYTVFKHGKPLGFYDTREETYVSYIRRFGKEPMDIRQVSTEYVKYGRMGEPISMGFPNREFTDDE